MEVLLNSCLSHALPPSTRALVSTSHPSSPPAAISDLRPTPLSSHRDRLAGTTLWRFKSPHHTQTDLHGVGVLPPYSSHPFAAPATHTQTQHPTHPADGLSPISSTVPYPTEVNVAALLHGLQDKALRRLEHARNRFQSLSHMGDLELDLESDLDPVTPRVLQNILILIKYVRNSAHITMNVLKNSLGCLTYLDVNRSSHFV